MTDPSTWSCPLPLADQPVITMAHGGGGQRSADLVEHLFLPAFGPAAAGAALTDAAVVELGPGRVACTTDSYVVQPLFFPGGDIGTLAINGTVNDLAMVGARPRVLTTAFVLEEGLELAVLDRIARSMGRAAAAADVRLLAGDTKVIERSSGDGLYITTSGIGTVDPDITLEPAQIQPGDRILVSGPIGRHGVAVLSRREGLEFGTTIESDCAPLHDLVQTLLAGGTTTRALRDLTRGGLATALCELAETASVGIEFDEALVPVPEPVRAACGFLGLDPLVVANEGTMVAFVAPSDAEHALATMHAHHRGRGAAIIGEVVAENPGSVVARTALGGRRVVLRPLGEQLPRIC
ncbi:MAG: hydrogenase expression/formation protein HypE [Acidimicrobiales bacterium]|nr:hydrogenase expression/formation protein HypE [Acidimicrobiales bacterium]